MADAEKVVLYLLQGQVLHTASLIDQLEAQDKDKDYQLHSLAHLEEATLVRYLDGIVLHIYLNGGHNYKVVEVHSKMKASPDYRIDIYLDAGQLLVLGGETYSESSKWLLDLDTADVCDCNSNIPKNHSNLESTESCCGVVYHMVLEVDDMHVENLAAKFEELADASNLELLLDDVEEQVCALVAYLEGTVHG